MSTTTINLVHSPLIKNASQSCDSSFREINSQEEFITKPLRYIMVVDLKEDTLPTGCDQSTLVSLAMFKETDAKVLDNSVQLMESKSYKHEPGIVRVELKFMLKCTTYKYNSNFGLALLAHGKPFWRSVCFRTLARKKDAVPRHQRHSGVHTTSSARGGSTRGDQNLDTPSRKRGIQKKTSVKKGSSRKQRPQQDVSNLKADGRPVEVNKSALQEDPHHERSELAPQPFDDSGSTIPFLAFTNLMDTGNSSSSNSSSSGSSIDYAVHRIDALSEGEPVNQSHSAEINHQNNHHDHPHNSIIGDLDHRSLQERYFFGNNEDSSDYLISSKNDESEPKDRNNGFHPYQQPDIVTLF